MINQSSELNRFMFDDENRDYKLKLLEIVKNYLFLENAPVLMIMICSNLKIALGVILIQKRWTISLQTAQTHLLSLKKHDCAVYYQDKKGFLSYSMGVLAC